MSIDPPVYQVHLVPIYWAPDMCDMYLVPLWRLWSIRDNRYYVDGYKNIYMTTMDLDAVKTVQGPLKTHKGDLFQRRGGVGCCGRRRVRVREAVVWVWQILEGRICRWPGPESGRPSHFPGTEPTSGGRWMEREGAERKLELQMETRAHGVFHIILRDLGSILRTTRDKEYQYFESA